MRSKHLPSAPKACLVYLKAAQKMLSYSLSWGMKKYDKYMKEYFILLSVNQKEPTATRTDLDCVKPSYYVMLLYHVNI